MLSLYYKMFCDKMLVRKYKAGLHGVQLSGGDSLKHVPSDTNSFRF